MTDIFSNEGEETTSTEDYLAQYVGEGKKFKDINELAKAYANADKFIPELKNDLQTTREFIASKLDEIAQRNSQALPNGQTEEPGGNQPAPVVPPNAEGEDLDTRIAKALEERDLAKRLEQNAQIVEDVLIGHLGSKDAAVEAVQAKARELGVEPGYLKQTAFQSPKAFFSLMGIDPDQKPQSNSTPAPSSDVNPRALGHGQPKPNTYAHYDQLRKSNPSLYWSPKTQAQMHKDAQENPDFFKR